MEEGDIAVIILTKLNDVEFVLNCDLIETIIQNPDTIIRLKDGNMFIVKENMQEVVDRTISFKRKIYSNTLGELLK